ncbi:hypothetical protein H1R20_g7690, partial [Candolleomyces eurysporus]
MEPFFWVFTYILLTYKPNGHRMPRTSYQESTVLNWLQEDLTTIWNSKQFFLHSPMTVWEARKEIDSGWDVIYDDLFLRFRSFARDVSYEKEYLLLNLAAPIQTQFQGILVKVDEHYACVLGLFDASLKKLKGTCVDELKSSSPPTRPASTSNSLTTNSGPTASQSPSVATSATSLKDSLLVEKRATPLFITECSVSSTSSPDSAPPVQPSTPPRLPKRGAHEAELEDKSPKELKRRCLLIRPRLF